MKIPIGEQFKHIDRYTMSTEPISSIDLIERVASVATKWILDRYDIVSGREKIHFIVFAGPNGNGSDAIAIARLLSDKGLRVKSYIFNLKNRLSPECETNKQRLHDKHYHCVEINDPHKFPEIEETPNCIFIDGLIGTGLKGNVSGPMSEVINQTNTLAEKYAKEVISIDIPSGLACEDNSTRNKNKIIKATHTLCVEFPKLSLFLPESEYAGAISILKVGLLYTKCKESFSEVELLEDSLICKMMRPRNAFANKGTYGNSLIIAGSRGMAGAAVLASRACLRSGVGKSYVMTPEENMTILQISTPETIVIPYGKNNIFDKSFLTQFKSIAIGPGMGTDSDAYKLLGTVLRNYDSPMVIDADALNMIAEHKELFEFIPEGSVLTPHPAEMERLFGCSRTNRLEQIKTSAEMAFKYKIYIVLKGHFSFIACPEKTSFVNPTGNAGMATAGCGDVLTGIIASLLAQGYTPKEAALIGTYIHGKAGDKPLCQESIIASDIINNIGNAIYTTRNNEYKDKSIRHFPDDRNN